MRDEFKDILCPIPTPLPDAASAESEPFPDNNALSTSSSVTLSTATMPSTTTANEPTAPTAAMSSDLNNMGASSMTAEKKLRKASRCGYCHQEGHTNRLAKGEPMCPIRLREEQEEK